MIILSMAFGNQIASKTMHLMHVPDYKELEHSFSHCHICLRKKSNLTKEHIPPRKAFNEIDRKWSRPFFFKTTFSNLTSSVKGGQGVRTLCEKCNTTICDKYAHAYVELVKQLVKKPTILDSSGEARLFNVNINPLYIAKEIATMILAVELIGYAQHVPELRNFVLNNNSTLVPPFKLYVFWVPNVPKAGTITPFHARVSTFAPGFDFIGGEISWFPFGFIYAYQIGIGYKLDKLTDITEWFLEKNGNKRISLKLYPRITGVDSTQSLLIGERTKPQREFILPTDLV